MLEDLLNTINNLKSFNFEDELKSIVEDNKQVIDEMQAEQLDKGVDRNNNPVTLDGRGYSTMTVFLKIQKGQPYDRVTWHDTGDLHETLKTALQGDVFEVGSNSFKFQKMIERSGDDVVGLNEDYRREFAELVTLPEIRERMKAKTGLNIISV